MATAPHTTSPGKMRERILARKYDPIVGLHLVERKALITALDEVLASGRAVMPGMLTVLRRSLRDLEPFTG